MYVHMYVRTFIGMHAQGVKGTQIKKKTHFCIQWVFADEVTYMIHWK